MSNLKEFLTSIKVKIVSQYGNKTHVLTPSMILKDEAKLAIRMIETYGMVAVDKPLAMVLDKDEPNSKLLTAEQVVERAFTIAELTYNKLIEKGLYVELPAIEEDPPKETKPKVE